MRRLPQITCLTMIPLLAVGWGCALRRPVATHAVAYNKAIADSQNRTMLLNVIRSMKRMPQQYTAVTQVVGEATASLTPTLTSTLSDMANSDSHEGSLSAMFSGGAAAVTVANLDDSEFVRGVLNPISLEQVEFFEAQGWPERLLGLLFIRRIEILDDEWQPTDPCKKEGARTINEAPEAVGDKKAPYEKEFVYLNEPEENLADPFLKVKCFGARLVALRDEGNLRIVTAEAEAVGPAFAANGVEELGQLILEASQAGYTVKEEGSAYKLYGAASKVLEWDQGDITRSIAQHDSPQSREYEQFKQTRDESEPPVSELRKTPRDRFFFRSPLGIVYYLGEIVRAQAALGYSAQTPVEELEPKLYASEGPVFVAWKKGKGNRNSKVKIVDGDETWVIPSFEECRPGAVEHCDRSTQVLAIITQLIGLNKEREKLPTTGVVTIAGG